MTAVLIQPKRLVTTGAYVLTLQAFMRIWRHGPASVLSRALALCAVVLGLSSSAMAARVIQLENGRVYVGGAIQKGDAQKLFNAIYLGNVEGFFMQVNRLVILESPGGDVSEALKMAKLLSSSYASTQVRNQCESACFLLYASGAQRIPPSTDSWPRLGIHNVYMTRMASVGMELADIANATREANLQMQAALRAQEVPEALIDKMVRIPGDQMFYLGPKEVAEIGMFKPSIEQALITKCNFPAAAVRKAYRAELRLDPWTSDILTKEESDRIMSCPSRQLSVAGMDGAKENFSTYTK